MALQGFDESGFIDPCSFLEVTVRNHVSGANHKRNYSVFALA